MTARRPKRENRIAVPLPGVPLGGGGAKQANDLGASIRPFIASGGTSYFQYYDPTPGPQFYDPLGAGTQLLAHAYVARGQMGFVKQIRVGPYRPSILQDPWDTVGVPAPSSASWRYIARTEVATPGANRLPQAFGIWETPFMWENYWNDDSVIRPSWRWSLRFVQGDIFQLRSSRQNIPPFNPYDPASLYLADDIPVPTALAYPQGIPGDAPGPTFDAQRMQHTPKAPLETHLVVPPDTTVCLFAQWEQTILDPNNNDDKLTTAVVNGNVVPYDAINDEVLQFPLMPSYGQIHGYVQALSARSNAASDNAELGW